MVRGDEDELFPLPLSILRSRAVNGLPKRKKKPPEENKDYDDPKSMVYQSHQ